MSDRELVANSYFDEDNLYRPLLKRILQKLDEMGFMIEEKTEDKKTNRESIEYKPTRKLTQNCRIFLEIGTGNIDNISYSTIDENDDE
jgi:hypothetical protein